MNKFSILLAISAFFVSAFAHEVDHKPSLETPQATDKFKGKERPKMPNVEDVFKNKNKASNVSNIAMPVGHGGGK